MFTLYSLTIHPFLGQFRIPFFRTLFYIFYVRFFLFFFFLRCEKESKEIERRDSIERYTNRGFNNYSRLLSEIVRSSRSRFSLERRNSSNYSIYKSNRRFCWTRFISHGRICFWQWFRTTEFSHGFPYYGKRYTGNGSWGAVRWASSTKSRDLEISRRNEIAWMPIHPAINKIFEKFDAKYESHERKRKRKKKNIYRSLYGHEKEINLDEFLK